MNNQAPPSTISKPPKRITYRISILFNDKNKGGTNCLFVKAFNEEEALKFASDNLEKEGYKIGSYRIETKKSSQSEIDFFLQNKSTLTYNGLLN